MSSIALVLTNSQIKPYIDRHAHLCCHLLCCRRSMSGRDASRINKWSNIFDPNLEMFQSVKDRRSVNDPSHFSAACFLTDTVTKKGSGNHCYSSPLCDSVLVHRTLTVFISYCHIAVLNAIYKCTQPAVSSVCVSK